MSVARAGLDTLNNATDDSAAVIAVLMQCSRVSPTRGSICMDAGNPGVDAPTSVRSFLFSQDG